MTQYYTATSIDGYTADLDNSLEWLFEVDEGTDNPFGAPPSEASGDACSLIHKNRRFMGKLLSRERSV